MRKFQGAYLGIKDKNGIDIKEGDIVREPRWDGSYIEDIVVYSSTFCGFTGKKGHALGLNSGLSRYLEVIGNIDKEY